MTTTRAADEIPEEALRLLGPLGRLGHRLGPRKTRILRAFIGAAAGGALGIGYYLLVGCSSGSCPITSNPVIATIYGAVVGVLVSGR
jgi:hypothetical protein